MHLELTPEALLIQLGYRVTKETLREMNEIFKNTKNIEKFLPHIPPFNDALAVEKAFIAMSNSQKYLKIKCNKDADAKNLLAFDALVKHWAEKYKLKLRAIKEKETYYIIGID